MAKLHVDGDQFRSVGKQKEFTLEGWIDTAPFEDLLGINIEKAEEGRAILSMPFTVKLAQGGGMLHGGALTTLADTAVAMAIKSLLPEKTIFATTELTTHFEAPVKEGQVTAIASVKGPEKRRFRGEAVIVDEEGREVATSRAVFRIARGQGFDD
ncbi:MAG TPA: PaaI family thioesterase [Desulfuromonadales bacterium]|nr:PaaI family thioesterase [Desulfuromonadales bacterium]